MKILDTFLRTESRKLTGRSEYWIVASLIMIGFVLRLITLGQDSLWIDEGYSMTIAQTPFLDMWKTPFDVHPPLYYSLLKPFLAFGPSEVALRLFSAICGTLVLIPIYLLAKQLIGNLGAIVSIALIDLSFTLLVYSSNGRNYAFLFLLFCTAMLALYRLYANLLKTNEQVGRSHLHWLALYYLATLTALYTHNASVIYIFFANAVILTCALIAMPTRVVAIGLKLIAFNIPVILGWIPWLVVIVSTTGDFDWLQQATLDDAIRTTAAVALPNRSTGLGVLISVIAIAIGTLACYRRSSDALVLGLAHLAVFPGLIWSFGFVYTPIFMERTVLPVILGSTLLTAAVIAYINSTRIAGGIIALAIAANLVSSSAYLTRDSDETNLGGFVLQNWRDAVQDSLAETGDTGIIVCASFSHPTVDFYARGSEIMLLRPNENLVRVTSEQWRFIHTLPVAERENGFFAAFDKHIAPDQQSSLNISELDQYYDQLTFIGASIYCNETNEVLIADRLQDHGWTPIEKRTYSGVSARSFLPPLASSSAPIVD